jgi:hypothetical protein
MITRWLLRIIAAVYAMTAIVHLLWFLSVAFYAGPGIFHQSGLKRLFLLGYVVFPFANLAVCSLIAYAFFAYRRWGRYLAISYNVLGLAAVSLLYTDALSSQGISFFRQLTKASVLVSIAIVTVIVVPILLCVRRDVRELMVK